MFVYLPIENEMHAPYLGRYRTFGLSPLHLLDVLEDLL